ncbi:hypothetical protein DFH11DRAFT_89876 [Phellopilus nigrolimitatus]|nr:hypothetical protein DFH11DRAFT_89876 [Phellopilus nigrolimitatus]
MRSRSRSRSVRSRRQSLRRRSLRGLRLQSPQSLRRQSPRRQRATRMRMRRRLQRRRRDRHRRRSWRRRASPLTRDLPPSAYSSPCPFGYLDSLRPGALFLSVSLPPASTAFPGAHKSSASPAPHSLRAKHTYNPHVCYPDGRPISLDLATSLFLFAY